MSLAGRSIVRRAKLLEGALDRAGPRMTDRELALLEVALVALLEIVRLYRKTRG